MRLFLAALLLAGPVSAMANAPVAPSAVAIAPGPSPTLAAVRAAKALDCAVLATPGDWNNDAHGNIAALTTEFCRAVAAAVLGEGGAVRVISVPGEAEALAVLKSGQAQVAFGLSPAVSVAIANHVRFGRPVFYDSVRLLIHRQAGFKNAGDLRGKLICGMDLSSPEQTLHDEMAAIGAPYGLQSHSEQGEMDAAVAVRKCDAGVGMETRLAESRAAFHAWQADFVFLPERWGLAPIVSATRSDDPAFGQLVDSVVDALIEAEALGVTQANVRQAAASRGEELRAGKLLGRDVAIPQALGLDRAWAANAIATTGNYGEVFARTVGKSLRLERGLNALWTAGGLMAPQPLD